MAARTSVLKNLPQIFDATHLWVPSALFNQEMQFCFAWSHTGLKPWGFLTLFDNAVSPYIENVIF